MNQLTPPDEQAKWLHEVDAEEVYREAGLADGDEDPPTLD